LYDFVVEFGADAVVIDVGVYGVGEVEWSGVMAEFFGEFVVFVVEMKVVGSGVRNKIIPSIFFEMAGFFEVCEAFGRCFPICPIVGVMAFDLVR
jgi:hypothetical protein